MYYSASWQLLEERLDDDGPTFADSPTSTDIDRHMQYAWGIRYIDEIYVHREDADKDGSYDKTYYHLTDPQFSTVALIDRSAVVAERVTYTAYGQGRHRWLFDVDGDGGVEIDDLLAISSLVGTPIGNSAYRSECDIDRSGEIDNDDLAGSSLEAALAFGLISDSSSGGVDNQIGYDGYVFNTETQEYLARNRYYEPELGRWLRRDPFGTRPSVAGIGEGPARFDPQEQYGSGMNLYEYVASRPTVLTNLEGLRPITTLFGAFISGGPWLPEPVPGSPWFFATDNRGFGGGSYRLFGYGWVESSQLGRINRSNSNAWIGTGASVRRKPAPGGGWIYESAKATPAGGARSKNTGRCSTIMIFDASASYPFFPSGGAFGRAVAGIDFRWIVEFTVVKKDVVGVSYWGWHDAFPDYEGFIDKGSVYTYPTPFAGPTIGNLGPGGNVTIPGLGFTVNAKTPSWCCKKGN